MDVTRASGHQQLKERVLISRLIVTPNRQPNNNDGESMSMAGLPLFAINTRSQPVSDREPRCVFPF